jgi:predicted permease
MLAQYRSRKIKFPDLLGNKTLIIAGAGDETITGIKVERLYRNTRNFLKLDEASLIQGSGDGTVPIISSTAWHKRILTLAVNKQQVKNPLVSASFHGLMLRESSIQNIIKRFFENDTLYTPASDISDLQSLGDRVEKVFIIDN